MRIPLVGFLCYLFRYFVAISFITNPIADIKEHSIELEAYPAINIPSLSIIASLKPNSDIAEMPNNIKETTFKYDNDLIFFDLFAVGD